MGCTDLTQHEIEMVEGAVPHKEPSRRLSPEKQRQAREQVDEYLEKGVIEPSKSPWGSGIVTVTKKGTAELRMCVNFRNLNACAVKDAYPLPRIDDSITNLGDARYFTVLDICRAFWQVRMRDADKHKTAFSTPRGLFQWTRMSFGLCSATATFASD